MVDVGDGDCPDGLADEVDVVSFDVLDDHDALLGKEVQGEFVGGVLEDALLNQEDVGLRGDDLLDHFSDDLALFFHDAVHGLVVLDDD